MSCFYSRINLTLLHGQHALVAPCYLHVTVGLMRPHSAETLGVISEIALEFIHCNFLVSSAADVVMFKWLIKNFVKEKKISQNYTS